MKQAIISGATGFVGKAVTKFLVKNNVEVLCIGRRPLTSADIRSHFDLNLSYIPLDMEHIERLPEFIDKLNWRVSNECIFFNFAWCGYQKLTDGTFEDQLKNVTFVANALKISKKIGCIKFINSGSLEETYTEISLKNKNTLFASSQSNYALAKLATRDMCLITAYLEKIDYVHTRLSVPLDCTLSSGSYIAKTLRDISRGRPYEQPKNNQLFDIIFLDDVAKAYFLVGKHGKNKSNYFIGTSRPTTLKDYFSDFDLVVRGLKPTSKQQSSNLDQIFSIHELFNDTGFIPSTDRLKLIIN